MNYEAFSLLLSRAVSPVVLLEGTRELPSDMVPVLNSLAVRLAQEFPHVRFRTGNAKGADEAFAAGVASVDPSRIEFVLPYEGHRRRERPSGSCATAIDELTSARVQEVIEATVAASPQYERVAVNYLAPRIHPRQLATARLILRDTLKVTGSDTLMPPVAGVFFVHSADPDRGGTGHTMRVCRSRGIPVIDQFQWLEWNQ